MFLWSPENGLFLHSSGYNVRWKRAFICESLTYCSDGVSYIFQPGMQTELHRVEMWCQCLTSRRCSAFSVCLQKVHLILCLYFNDGLRDSEPCVTSQQANYQKCVFYHKLNGNRAEDKQEKQFLPLLRFHEAWGNCAKSKGKLCRKCSQTLQVLMQLAWMLQQRQLSEQN